MTSVEIDCMRCRYFFPAIKKTTSCRAFPNGIPEEIIWGDVEHIKPIRGDHGFQFKEMGD